jgi:16S rRNA (guanine527-N7)-methyltransferase
MFDSLAGELASLLRAHGVGRRVSELAEYGALVLEANRRFNLTGAKTAGELAEHLLDSLSVAPYVGDPLVDVGSGAGFPAIPLAIATGVRVTLIESARKKARFLEGALARFGLVGSVVAERAETAGREEGLRERFACGTARALAGATTAAELLLPLIAVGGCAVLQRGRMDASERAALEDAALVLGARFEREIEVGGNRRILLVRKVAPTPQRFPRRAGIPDKRPLCVEQAEGVSR